MFNNVFLCLLFLINILNASLIDDDLRKSDDIKKYEISCKNSVMEDCHRTAIMYSDETPIKNISKAINLYKKACDNNYYKSCLNLGYVYYDKKFKKYDARKAKYYYEKACENEEVNGCFNLALLHSNKDNSYYDKNKSLQLFEKACAKNEPTSCYNLAILSLEKIQ